MDPTLQACLQSWSFDPWLCGGVILAAVIYLRGAQILRRRGGRGPARVQTLAFLAGLATIFIALVSPLDTLADLLLSVHMVQHLLLMVAAPILLWIGQPLRELELGLPRPIVQTWLVPLRNTPLVRGILQFFERPFVGAVAFVVVMWGWHLPGAYELALGSPRWHRIEHASFLAVGLLFWRPVIEFLGDSNRRATRRDARQRPAYWLLPYLFLTDVAGTLLGAILAFSNHVLYPHYARLPPLAGLSALDDQALAGGLMWVLGSLALLGPLGWIGYWLLLDDHSTRASNELRVIPTPMRANGGVSAARISNSPVPFDLLRVPGLGNILRSRHARLALRFSMLALAAAIVLDGLTGPQMSAMNLAGVLPWVHWRGVAVLGVLLVGNVVCASCPFTLPRSFLRRHVTPRWEWPRALRNKWLAAVLLATFFLAYEVFDLWASPWWTAWIVLGYFLAVALVDSFFRGAAFCKYVCPIGQFQFVQSLVTPLEIRPRELATCTSCRTHDCIVGNQRSTGCELELFVPRKSSNLDCTLCLACVDACPTANVGLIATPPLQALSTGRLGVSTSQPSGRLDLALLLVVFVFGAFANALGMVGPVVQLIDRLANATPLPRQVLEALGFVTVALVVPLTLLCLTTVVAGWRLPALEAWSSTWVRGCMTLVPIGIGMWVAHYGFHFLSGPWSFVPVGERFFSDWGLTGLPAPDWSFNCCARVADGVLKFEILALDLGLLASLYLAYRVVAQQAASPLSALRAWAPWACLIAMLFSLGIWIVFQPMEMRGMLSAGGAG